MEHGTRAAYTHGGCRCDACREVERAYQQAYRQTNGERLRAYDRRPERDSRLRDDPEKRRVREQTAAAIRTGRLVRQPCEECGAEPADAHHDDYSRPLDVRWLCKPCHAIAHRLEPRT